MARILLTTLGSLGDLHPYVAVGLGLRQRGHDVIIGTSENYRSKVEGEGLGFAGLGPDMDAVENDPETMRRVMHPARGTEFVIRELILPHLESAYERTLEAARDCDLILGHAIAYATPMAAEKLKKPWLSVALQPAAILSAYDPVVISGAPFLRPFQSAGPGFWRVFFNMVRVVARRWGKPINELRRKVGLREVRNPIFDDMHSPYGVQAWVSGIMFQPHPDWPPGTEITGFPFYDRREAGDALNPDLSRFLDSGAAPVVFTLGSSAVYVAGEFYNESIEAARMMGLRAVLLTGRNRIRETLPDSIFACDYAPYSELLPRAAATVHQGGIGTTAQALRAGKPMIVVPFSHDQPDNAMRMVRIGAGRTISRSAYRAKRVARELSLLLGKEQYAKRSDEIGAHIAREDGVAAACDGIEKTLAIERRC